MNENGVVTRDNGVLEVSGRMTFQTVPEFLSQASARFSDGASAITVDLGKVVLVDSAGIALLLEWMSQARARRRELTFVNLPQQVRRFIGVSGLNKAFGLKE